MSRLPRRPLQRCERIAEELVLVGGELEKGVNPELEGQLGREVEEFHPEAAGVVFPAAVPEPQGPHGIDPGHPRGVQENGAGQGMERQVPAKLGDGGTVEP